MKSLAENVANWDPLLDQQRNLWESGERPQVDALLQQFGLSLNQEARLDLLYNEVVLREEAGERPSLEDYLPQYPALSEALTAQFEVHRALVDGILLDTDNGQFDDSSPDYSDRSVPAMYPCLPDYEIIREIGRGGSAVVYQARHVKLQRDVALKMLHPERKHTPRELLRFRSEAAAAARLSHPHIVQIFEIGEWDETPYLALELAEGGTLGQKLQKTLMFPQEAAVLIEQLARAVQQAHERQVIHRDLKPANILFTRDGVAKVADFGLAKILEEDFELPRDVTHTGEPLGTPRYMSPEQATGQTDRIGPPTDVYALGTLLYECLTGQAPFVATSVVDTLQKISREEPRSPIRLQPSIPRDLTTICLHCLQKEPDKRYASAQALADDLQRFLAGKTIAARPTPFLQRVAKWCRRRPADAALIGLATSIVLGFVAAQLITQHQEKQRISQYRMEIADLMQLGQESMDSNAVDDAQHFFAKAWRIVQSEPALNDHLAGVSGWLDHSQRAASIQLWQGRLPPREYDDRRDLAIVESLLLEPRSPDAVRWARAALLAARELTLPDDIRWQTERELLATIESELIAFDSGDVPALEFLNASGQFSSRFYCERKGELLRRLSDPAATELFSESRKFPPDREALALMEGIFKTRHRRFAEAEPLFAEILVTQPAHFLARLLQAICFAHCERWSEAKIALTACIAQRPTFPWSYYWRGVVLRAEGDDEAARRELRRVRELEPSATLEFVIQKWDQSMETRNAGSGNGG